MERVGKKVAVLFVFLDCRGALSEKQNVQTLALVAAWACAIILIDLLSLDKMLLSVSNVLLTAAKLLLSIKKLLLSAANYLLTAAK